MGQVVHDDLGDPNARQTCETRGLVVTLLAARAKVPALGLERSSRDTYWKTVLQAKSSSLSRPCTMGVVCR